MRPLRVLALSVAVATVLVTSPAVGAPPGPRVRTWWVTRTGAGPAPLSLEVDVEHESSEWMSLVLGLREERGVRKPTFSSRAHAGGAEQLGMYENGRVVVGPCSVTGCGDPGAGGGGGGHTSGLEIQSTQDDVLVVTLDGAATISVSDGWRVRVAPPVTYRRVTAMGSGASGVNAGAVRYEEYRGSTAPGGRYGSVAWASLPCSYAGSGAGELRAVRRSATQSWPMACSTPSDGTYGERGWIDGAAVSWVIEADVTGIDSSSERLFVLDLPKRTPHPAVRPT